MTFYLKYRSKGTDELDIAEVRETLSRIISSGKVPHALLFAGPRGTGKTSAARILAKALNCEKPGKNGEACDECGQCISIKKGENLDVIEIDAASHRGIDDVRGIRDAVKLAPAFGKMKIYIIDEAHMLTTEASNALLKTLEEPPSHVVFILATTNPEKLIDTIKSRTTKVNFRKATTEEIVRSLKRVVKGEGLKIEEDELKSIAESSEGSFRDAVKMLEELSLSGSSITSDVISKKVTGFADFDPKKFFDLMTKGKEQELIEMIENASSKGFLAKNMLKAIIDTLRSSLLSKTLNTKDDNLPHLDKERVLFLIEHFSKAAMDISGQIIDQLPLEVAIIKLSLNSEKDGGEKEKKSKIITNNDTEGGNTSDKSSLSSEPVVINSGVSETISTLSEPGFWVEIMARIRPINASTEALLRASHPLGFDGKTLTIGVYYKFHKEKLEALPHRKILEDLLQEVVGEPVRIICTLSQQPIKNISPEEKSATLTETSDTDIMKVAEEIFGN